MNDTTRAGKSSQEQQYPHSLDLIYITKQIPIEDVWRELADEHRGLGMGEIQSHQTRCIWHDDQTPSYHFSKNNKAKCYVCDVGLPYYSNLDLVKKVLQCELPEALIWFQAHWNIPELSAGRPAGLHKNPHPIRVGYGGPLESIIRSGLFCELPNAARLLLPVLVAVQDERKECDWSYPTLMAATGIGSPGSIAKAIDALEQLHVICIRKTVRQGQKFQSNIYRLTLDHLDLIKRIEDASRAHHYANEQARELARANRMLRSHSKKLLVLQNP